MKPTILIAPYARALRNGKTNPKNFPYWAELVKLLEPDYDIIQIGVTGEPALVSDVRHNCSLAQLKDLIDLCAFWISVDSFLPHMAHYFEKPGFVIWSVSDPKIFGYPDNYNILKDVRYLRNKQFDIWEACNFDANAFVSADEVYKLIKLKFG